MIENNVTTPPECACKTVDSPIGQLKLVASAKGLVAVLWENDDPKRVNVGAVVEDAKNPVLAKAEKQLKEYFAGKRRVFDLKLDLIGTAFQKKVWQALLKIPFGQTRSYSEVAREIGSPKAARAVGAANGKNPIGIIAPCHRVVGASGELTGFAGGLVAKSFLLDHEISEHAETLGDRGISIV